MYVNNIKNIKSIDINIPGVLNTKKQTLVGPNEGWDGWVMRLFTLSQGGNTPLHSHPWQHINYVVSGKGYLLLDNKQHLLESGSVAYVSEDAEHQFNNCGEEDFVFICIVPEKGDV